MFLKEQGAAVLIVISIVISRLPIFLRAYLISVRALSVSGTEIQNGGILS
jgi:hypothetical protein